MHTYRIVLDAYHSRSTARGARVVLYVQAIDRDSAFRRIRTVAIDTQGAVYPGTSRDIDGWIGTNNMAPGPYVGRTLPEWECVSIRSVKAAGKSRVLSETE